MRAPPPYPGPLSAVLVCLAAWFATGACVVLFAPDVENLSIGVLGLGQAVGMGLVTTLAARWVPEPQAERLGLQGFDPRWLLPILLMLPLAIVVSELVNSAQALFPPPDADALEALTRDRIATDGLLSLLETLIVVVGIAPVLEEWLYRGVVQQGLVGHLGRVAGVGLTAALFGLAHFQPSWSAASSLATFVAVLPLGIALGALRLASGSLLAPILLHAAYNAVGVTALSLSERWPVPGFNAPGDHTPATIWVPCAMAAVIGLVPVLRGAREAPPAPPVPPPAEPDEGSGWGL